MEAPGGCRRFQEAQLEIMNVVWDRGDVMVADVWKVFSFKGKVLRNTVLTMLTRPFWRRAGSMRDSFEHAHRYRATVPRDATLGTMISFMVGPDSIRRISRGADGGFVA